MREGNVMVPRVGDNTEHRARPQLSAPKNSLPDTRLCHKLFFFFFPAFNFFFRMQRRGNERAKQGTHPIPGLCQQAGKRAQESSEKSKKKP